MEGLTGLTPLQPFLVNDDAWYAKSNIAGPLEPSWLIIGCMDGWMVGWVGNAQLGVRWFLGMQLDK